MACWRTSAWFSQIPNNCQIQAFAVSVKVRSLLGSTHFTFQRYPPSSTCFVAKKGYTTKIYIRYCPSFPVTRTSPQVPTLMKLKNFHCGIFLRPILTLPSLVNVTSVLKIPHKAMTSTKKLSRTKVRRMSKSAVIPAPLPPFH